MQEGYTSYTGSALDWLGNQSLYAAQLAGGLGYSPIPSAPAFAIPFLPEAMQPAAGFGLAVNSFLGLDPMNAAAWTMQLALGGTGLALKGAAFYLNDPEHFTENAREKSKEIAGQYIAKAKEYIPTFGNTDISEIDEEEIDGRDIDDDGDEFFSAEEDDDELFDDKDEILEEQQNINIEPEAQNLPDPIVEELEQPIEQQELQQINIDRPAEVDREEIDGRDIDDDGDEFFDDEDEILEEQQNINIEPEAQNLGDPIVEELLVLEALPEPQPYQPEVHENAAEMQQELQQINIDRPAEHQEQAAALEQQIAQPAPQIKAARPKVEFHGVHVILKPEFRADYVPPVQKWDINRLVDLLSTTFNTLSAGIGNLANSAYNALTSIGESIKPAVDISSELLKSMSTAFTFSKKFTQAAPVMTI